MTMKQILLVTALTIASIGSAWPQASADHQGYHPPEASTPAPQTAPTPAQPQQSPGATMSGPMQSGRMQQPASRSPHAQSDMMMNCPMMSGSAQEASPAMMQMMQGMMQ